ncbi:MAG: GPR endopeptidase [Faecalibacterium sp.]
MKQTDLADELFGEASEPQMPAGVRLATARRNGVRITRVEITREGLARPRGRYVTLETPSVAVLDERDSTVIELAAAQLRALLPPQGPVLVLGVGNRRVTADALGPRTVQKVLVTMGAGHRLPLPGVRPVAAVAPGVAAATGVSLQQMALALVRELRPTALVCVDSLCSSEPQRLGRTMQFSDTGLHPAQPDSARHLDAARMGVPVIAAGIPTLMEAEEGRDLVVTPRELDSVISHGAALLGAAINRALQPQLTLSQLCWLVG